MGVAPLNVEIMWLFATLVVLSCAAACRGAAAPPVEHDKRRGAAAPLCEDSCVLEFGDRNKHHTIDVTGDGECDECAQANSVERIAVVPCRPNLTAEIVTHLFGRTVAAMAPSITTVSPGPTARIAQILFHRYTVLPYLCMH